MIRGRWRRRVALAPLLAILLAVFGAGPASAHVIGTSAKPCNYRTRVLNISPPVPGVTVRVVEAGGKLELTNHSSQPVLVLGYDNEPYLRVGPSGVQENERSPSTWSNRSAVPPKTRPPAGLDPSAPPQWRRISTAPVAIWHDHRSHWAGPGDPAAVRAARGRTQVVVPDWRLWIAVAVLLCAAVLLLARLDASLRLWALIPATVLAVAADIIHASGSWLGSTASTITKLYSNATPLAGWIVAGLAIWRLLRDRDRAASRSPAPSALDLEAGNTYLLIAGIFLAVAGALPDIGVLDSSQIPEPFPPLLTRSVVAITLGLGASLVLAVLLGRPPAPSARTQPEPDATGGHTAAAS